MYRWSKVVAIVVTLSLLLLGCQSGGNNTAIHYEKYSGSFYDSFNTLTQFVAYTKSEEEFQQYYDQAHERFIELHQFYDIYNDYEGINNIKTINDHAGIEPVKVDRAIIDLILFSKKWAEQIGSDTNIAMGSVLQIWHDYREAGIDDPMNAMLPPIEKLMMAAEHIDLDQVIVDTDNNTVYLADQQMSLNVGAVAKGYATEIVANELMAEGLLSGMISAGGNVRAIHKPLDNVRERWGVGLQNPDKFIAVEEDNLLDTIFVDNASVVSSGDYQRYYVVDGETVHHLIDPKTLMPGQYYRAVTIVTEDSGVADFLSTATFLLPFEESKALIESLEDVEAVWVMPDGTVKATDGMEKIMKSHGATGAKSE
ncbi:FAD:protein FMN transferase [Paenibacillus crassostreae]|uniref:FAD:protein FMN transferase n=1 Tax=Paenibacillus crassostreae TaxID=1763538 RepID=A0A167AT03_9BACL|nr:FAD:protein FMN transferase [Paenibacillus crassostreae]AOZ93703.1 thiamine biosynthesis protein ApbE [Paenibacillus crassostreae]OAB71397.1 thiamine biosynthesis protein ApbE [Paenibacillus crassostreae]